MSNLGNAVERARRDLAEDRKRWNMRLVTPSGAVIVHVYAIERRILAELLADAVFTHPSGLHRGEGVRVEVEPAQVAS